MWALHPKRHKSFALAEVSSITAMAMSTKKALLGRRSGVIELLDLKSGRLTELFRSVFSDPVCDLSISHSGEVMMAVMESGRVYMSGSGREAQDWVRVRGGEAASAIRLDQKNDVFAVARRKGKRPKSPSSPSPRTCACASRPGSATSTIWPSPRTATCSAPCLPAPSKVSLYQVINAKHLIDVGAEGAELVAMDFSPKNELLGYLSDGERLYVRSLQHL